MAFFDDAAASLEAQDLSTDRLIASRMRFVAPAKFLEFYERQLSSNIVGLRHPDPLPEGTELLLIVSPPGAPDRLRLRGRTTQIKPRPDGSFRLRVELAPSHDDLVWLEAYVTGLRATLDRSECSEDDEPSGESSRGRVLRLAASLDTVTYYQLLGVPADVDPRSLQARFHELTRELHPDLYHGTEDHELARAVNLVYRRMNEAYAVLKSSHRRRAYDRGLAGPPHTWQIRLSEQAHQEARRRDRVRSGTTRTGDYYWTTARTVLERARSAELPIRPALRESARLLRTALAFEPDNEHFQHALDQVLDRLAAPEEV